MLARIDSLPVVAFTGRFHPNLDPFGDVPWQRYHEVRNALVRACRRQGPTGPTGVIKLDPDVAKPLLGLIHDPNFWEPGDPNPAYYVLDD